MSPRNRPGVGDRPDASGRSTLRGYNARGASSSGERRRSLPSCGDYCFHIIDRCNAIHIIASLSWGEIGVSLSRTMPLTTRNKSARKKWLVGLGVLALVWVLACTSLFAVMRQSPDKFARVMARVPGPVAFLVLPFETLWTHARAGTLRVGDPAPDFSLMKLDKSAQVQLSELTAQRKPVALVFGSYT